MEREVKTMEPGQPHRLIARLRLLTFLMTRCAVGKNSIADMKKKMQEIKSKAKGVPEVKKDELGTEMKVLKSYLLEEEAKTRPKSQETDIV